MGELQNQRPVPAIEETQTVTLGTSPAADGETEAQRGRESHSASGGADGPLAAPAASSRHAGLSGMSLNGSVHGVHGVPLTPAQPRVPVAPDLSGDGVLGAKSSAQGSWRRDFDGGGRGKAGECVPGHGAHACGGFVQGARAPVCRLRVRTDGHDVAVCPCASTGGQVCHVRQGVPMSAGAPGAPRPDAPGPLIPGTPGWRSLGTPTPARLLAPGPGSPSCAGARAPWARLPSPCS